MASNTEYFKFKGLCKWPRLVKPDEKYARWSINVYLDKPSMKLFDKSGMQLEVMSDDDGEFVKFSRPTTKVIKDELVKFDAPACTNALGAPIDGFTIGNGSLVEVDVSVFPTKKGKGHRLNSVKVHDLVEFVPQSRE